MCFCTWIWYKYVGLYQKHCLNCERLHLFDVWYYYCSNLGIVVADVWWNRGVLIRIGIWGFCIEWGVKGVWSAYWSFSTSCWLFLVWPWWAMGYTSLSTTKMHLQVIHMVIPWYHLAVRYWWLCRCRETSLIICLKLGKISHFCLIFGIKLLSDVLCGYYSWDWIIRINIDPESIRCLLCIL